MNLLKRLQQHFSAALGALSSDPAPYLAMIQAAKDPKFGDYQANCAMSLGKALGKPPREVAQAIASRLPPSDFLDTPEIAGPGFINLRLKSDWLAVQLRQMALDPRLGIEAVSPAPTIVIDYSSPNVAKPMHVGHLRSTIIGDSLARLFRFLGHRVIADNHLGDWGTQFGMMLYGYKHFLNPKALEADPVKEMARLYIEVRKLIKPAEQEQEEESPQDTSQKYTPAELERARAVQAAARQETAKLHAGDSENLALWQKFMPWCQEEIDRVYRRLDVHFDRTHGESFYNPFLADVVADLQRCGLAQESQGALVVQRPPDQRRMKDEPPALIRKSDGAFMYMTSDLATIRYRTQTWNPARILYVVDERQSLHFELFWIAKRWGYPDVELTHISFGSVLDPPTRKPIKTREGSAVATLTGLLDEGVEEAARRYEALRKERQEQGQEVPELSAEEKRQIAEVVGLGSIKYADLSQNRTSDYVFSWDKMIAFEGNTAAYMQYSYARNRSIFRKGGEAPERYRTEPPLPALARPEERLALQLLRFQDALETAAAEYKPNAVTGYLLDLSKSYSGFYQNCKVLEPEQPELRPGRLLLCDLTARVIQKGLDLLGIRTVERM